MIFWNIGAFFDLLARFISFMSLIFTALFLLLDERVRKQRERERERDRQRERDRDREKERDKRKERG